MKRCLSGNLSLRKGSKPTRRISTNKEESIIPSKMMMSVGPFRLIPAHTCTLMGCLGLTEKMFVHQSTLYTLKPGSKTSSYKNHRVLPRGDPAFSQAYRKYTLPTPTFYPKMHYKNVDMITIMDISFIFYYKGIERS